MGACVVLHMRYCKGGTAQWHCMPPMSLRCWGEAVAVCCTCQLSTHWLDVPPLHPCPPCSEHPAPFTAPPSPSEPWAPSQPSVSCPKPPVPPASLSAAVRGPHLQPLTHFNPLSLPLLVPPQTLQATPSHTSLSPASLPCPSLSPSALPSTSLPPSPFTTPRAHAGAHPGA